MKLTVPDSKKRKAESIFLTRDFKKYIYFLSHGAHSITNTSTSYAIRSNTSRKMKAYETLHMQSFCGQLTHQYRHFHFHMETKTSKQK